MNALRSRWVWFMVLYAASLLAAAFVIVGVRTLLNLLR